MDLYETVGFIHMDERDGWHRHTQVMECQRCGALVSAKSFEIHDQWHAEVVTPS